MDPDRPSVSMQRSAQLYRNRNRTRRSVTDDTTSRSSRSSSSEDLSLSVSLCGEDEDDIKYFSNNNNEPQKQKNKSDHNNKAKRSKRSKSLYVNRRGHSHSAEKKLNRRQSYSNGTTDNESIHEEELQSPGHHHRESSATSASSTRNNPPPCILMDEMITSHLSDHSDDDDDDEIKCLNVFEDLFGVSTRVQRNLELAVSAFQLPFSQNKKSREVLVSEASTKFRNLLKKPKTHLTTTPPEPAAEEEEEEEEQESSPRSLPPRRVSLSTRLWASTGGRASIIFNRNLVEVLNQQTANSASSSRKESLFGSDSSQVQVDTSLGI